MSSGNNFMTTVPELTGPNYTLWASKSKSWLQSQGISYVLNTLHPRTVTITNAGTQTVPAEPATPAAGSDAGSDDTAPLTHFFAVAGGEAINWDKDNEKAMGIIKLHVTQAIGLKLNDMDTAREMWTLLKNLYGKPGATEVFQNFKQAMNIEIPCNTQPGAAIDLIKMYLTHINNAGTHTLIPMYLQYMIVINKLPGDIHSYIISRKTEDDVDAFETGSLDSL
ncbi:hypothetical protein D9758_013531 [Tetrapyrgos nigripes]|uniref:Gag protein n=1 Tax=Tetrapyrgos nigripes TaxID=182062 RepID=A0A8H5FWE7_9AGAR|nr:hypothetical protein D9758_013531 [Tetrapyrgos nigripes]